MFHESNGFETLFFHFRFIAVVREHQSGSRKASVTLSIPRSTSEKTGLVNEGSSSTPMARLVAFREDIRRNGLGI